MVKINGKKFDIAGKTLLEFLLSEGYEISCIAVELNGNILPRADYKKTILSDGDSLEIVSFVGGG